MEIHNPEDVVDISLEMVPLTEKSSVDYEVYPLSDGNGRYDITVYENINDDSGGNRSSSYIHTSHHQPKKPQNERE